MSDDLRTRIWRLLEAHGTGWINNGTDLCRCYCGYRAQRLGESWHYHTADAVIRELGMREERWKTDDPTMLRGHWTRYVTDWTHPDE